MSDRPIRVALPNKGRLSERALELFELAGLRPAFVADRALMASLGERFQAIFVRTQDIPEYLADGAAELGGPVLLGQRLDVEGDGVADEVDDALFAELVA